MIITRTHKEYYNDNKDKISKYYNDNKADILERVKEYRESNKEKISAIRKEKMTCDICNSIFSKYKLSRHVKSIKHQNALPVKVE